MRRANHRIVTTTKLSIFSLITEYIPTYLRDRKTSEIYMLLFSEI